jgi:hypothetical protein
MDTTPSDDRAPRAAAFLAQALELGQDVDPLALAADLTRLKVDPQAAIYAAELDSSVGPTAFLVYVYSFAATGPDGRTGREFFEADLATLETAAEREAPGPRVVAHARSEDEGFILATTPATLRALRGETPPEALESLQADAGDLLPTGDVAEARRTGAEELLRLLRAADREAARWLAALQADGRLLPDAADGEIRGTIAFNDAETELALFLLDERSIQSLLRALNVLLTAARAGASEAFGPDSPGVT